MKIDYASIFAQVKLETHYFSYLYMTLTFRNWPFVFVYIPQKLWKYRWKFLLAYLYYSHMNISCCNWIYKTAFILIYIINIVRSFAYNVEFIYNKNRLLTQIMFGLSWCKMLILNIKDEKEKQLFLKAPLLLVEFSSNWNAIGVLSWWTRDLSFTQKLTSFL